MVDEAPISEEPKVEQIQNTKEPELSDGEKRAKYFIDDLDRKLTDENINIAVTLIIDPQNPSQPVIYSRGSIYGVTKLLVEFARYFKRRLNEELEV